LPVAINFRALGAANLVTYPPDFWGYDTFELHRVDGPRENNGTGKSSLFVSAFKIPIPAHTTRQPEFYNSKKVISIEYFFIVQVMPVPHQAG